ncbi:adult cuticle protein 1-like [Chironomus tepperi]|uniref:adult cuticle protein 1-like n=1 Tax=Chironomus tepperi TaxID=113505 RepID=UPI00391F676B
MKVFALVALFFACAQASAVWPYAAPWAYSAYSHAPITQYSSYPAAHYAHAPAISYAAHVAAPYVAAPYVAAPYVAAPYVHAPVAKVVALPHAATYTAANKGSVHTAPLPGHTVSQTSLNLAPAPGTH